MKQIIVATVVALAVAGCSDCVRTEFSTLEAAKVAKAFDRGWLPPILPDGTTQIVEENNVESNFGQGSFHFPPKSAEAYLETMRTIYGASIATDNAEIRLQIKTANSCWTIELNRQMGRGKYTVSLKR